MSHLQPYYRTWGWEPSLSLPSRIKTHTLCAVLGPAPAVQFTTVRIRDLWAQGSLIQQDVS